MKMKRFFAIFAIIAVLCTFCTVTAMAEETTDPTPAGTSYATHYEAGQDYNGGKILEVENATCTKAGTIKYTDASGNTAVATIPAPGHDYKEVVTVAAGCETEGTYKKVCKVCGETVDGFKIAPTGHNYSEYETITNTCAEHTAYKVCPNCKENECGEGHYELQEKKGPDGKVVIGQDGKPVMERKVYTLPIEKDHEFDKEVVVSKTCTTDGSTTLLCKYCSATKVIDTEPAGHNYGENPVSEVIDCTHVKVTYVCKDCPEKTDGHTKTVTLEVDAHQWVKDEKASKDATCTEAGKSVYECSVCHATKTETEKAIGHDWGEWECTIVHSTDDKGVQTGWWTRTCKNPGCDATETKFSKGAPKVEQPAAPADPPATPPAQEPGEPVADSYVIDGTEMTLTEKGVEGTGRIVPIGGDKIAESTVVRVAYILENADGTTGLYTTYAPLVDGNNFSLPGFDFPGITVKAACIVVVPDLANVQTPTPETLSSIVKF